MDTLIVFKSKYGSAKRCAEYLNENIRGSVAINLAENEPNIDCFDNVIAGGSVYNGKLSPSLCKFFSANQKKLKEKNLYLWINCVTRQSYDEVVLKSIPVKLQSSAKKIVFASGELPESIGLYDRFRFISVQSRIAGLPAFKIDFGALDSIIYEFSVPNEK